MKHFNIKSFAIVTLVCTFLYLSISALAIAKSSSKSGIILPEEVLSAEQIEQLFAGKSVAATVEGKAKNTTFYFADDGKLRQIRNGWQRDGVWNVRADGRLCIELETSARDCRMIVKQDDKFRQYAVKKDGNHLYEITYNTFLEGEQLAKLSKAPILPEGTLKRKEIIELFSGHTVESVTARKGRVSQTYYGSDGSLVQIRNGRQRYGKWRVNKNDRICLQIDGLKEKCRIIVKEAGEVKKYIVKKNGQHQHSVSYRKFSSGKNF